MSEKATTRPTRKAWKVTLAMFPGQWDELRRWAEYRGISGGELIEAVLSHWLDLNPPPKIEPETTPDPEDA